MSKHKNVETVAHAPKASEEAAPEAPVVAAAVVVPAEIAAPAAVTAAPAPEAPVTAAAAPAVTPAPVAAAARAASTLYSVGVTWAKQGIGLGKAALEGLARALDRTAQRLGELQTRLDVNGEKAAV